MRKIFLISIVILFGFSANIGNAQQFPYGVYLDKGDSTNQLVYDYVKDSLGMNTVVQYSNWGNPNQKNLLSSFNLIASKNDSRQDAVAYYAGGYYTKWEAEDTTMNNLATGIKAIYGYETYYDNAYCWTSGDNINNANSVMLRGPHYRQDKKYKPRYMQGFALEYTLKLSAAAKEIGGIIPQPTDPVCDISVVFTYKQNQQIVNVTLAGFTLYVNSFSSEEFENFSLNYFYPPGFEQYIEKMSGLNQYELLDYDDTYPGTGIQFVVTWYGNKQLYVDFFQVYDQIIGDDIVNSYPQVVAEITSFSNKYSGWNNIDYFFNVSEPQTIDQYTPMRMVDDILEGLTSPGGIAEFYPQWNGWRNGDRTIYKFKELADPDKVMMEFITFVEGKPMEVMYEYQRAVLEEVANVNPDFWYESLIAEPTLLDPPYGTCWLYLPSGAKLNASLMLSLAHGAKGIIIWKLVPGATAEEFNCDNEEVWYNVILNDEYKPNDIYYYLRDNFGPRIGDKFGNTLTSINYTGNYLQLQYFTPTQNPVPDPPTYDYLTLGQNPSAEDMNWHAGFLVDSSNSDNKYFLLVNLWTGANKSVQVKVTEPVSGYDNYRFRNVEEGYFDTTFATQIIKTLSYPKGEGYLYQIAPVVKYGGRLI